MADLAHYPTTRHEQHRIPHASPGGDEIQRTLGGVTIASGDITTSSAYYHSPVIREHAKDRWVQRICSRQRGVAPWDLPDAFAASVPVGIPSTNRGRLHPPTDAVFVYNPRSQPIVITVWLAEWLNLNDSHLNTCEECGLQYDPTTGDCSWCLGAADG